MHMPGHKRNTGLVPSYYSHDITEIEGFDNLHAPSGILKDVEDDAASLWKAKSAVISVNGATAPILAAVMAASSRGKILIASNCHISVWHALELTDREFEVFDPYTDPKYPFCLQIDPDKLRNILEQDPGIRTVVITSPTSEGIVSDVKTITRIAHEHGAAVIADESHGAHFGLNEYFPESSEADIVIKSIHKTLHAPTQTAVLLTYSDEVSEDLIRHYMDIVESSSPSYMLMEGIARVVSDLQRNPGITVSWVNALRHCRGTLKKELKHIRLLDFPGADPGKLVIITGGVTDGRELAGILRRDGIEVEAAHETHVIAMTGIGDTDKTLKTFAEALIKADEGLQGTVSTSYGSILPSDPLALEMPVRDAVTSPAVTLKREDCEGKISASYCFKYPPGIPVLIPGQRITDDRLKFIGDAFLKVIRS